ncbi:fas-binding factor 1 homolog isoform X2 [Parambassis ranga]|uniref:Fas-binding factor 1 homolog isoform X2 n=1 Tax=Parambassis ranga TaxID=210632 RepID=A0A6P7IPR3_9TELE|nr:fas-binding factor 1 isoform X2 [Parambassis ranga]
MNMATKPKAKTTKSLFKDDDILDSLFDEDKQPVGGRAARGRPPTHSNNIFSMLADEVKRDGLDSGGSDVSAADPSDILRNIKDMDDMDADLFSLKKKPGSAPPQTKLFGNKASKKDSKPEAADEPSRGEKKPSSAPSSTAHSYKKFTFSDSDGEDKGQAAHSADVGDPLLDSLLPDETRSRPSQSRPVSASSASPVLKRDTAKTTKKSDVTFDENDDHMDALGFDSDAQKKEAPLWSSKERSEAPQRARSKINESLESLLSPHLLERPPTGERKPPPEEKQQERTSTVRDSLFEDGLTFGSYQPSLVSTPEGRQSRRQSVRFFNEDVGASASETKPRPTSSRHRSSADWLGLKTDTEDEPKEVKIASPQTPSSPLMDRKTSSNVNQATMMASEPPARADDITKQTKSEVSRSQPNKQEEEDWLASALSRKKTQPKLDDSLGLEEKVDHKLNLRAKKDTPPSIRDTSPAARSTPVREERPEPDPPTSSAASISHPQPKPHHPPSRVPLEPAQASDGAQRQPPLLSSLPAVLPGPVWVPQQGQTQSTPAAVPQQVTLSADGLQQLLLQQMMQTQLLGLGGGVADPAVLQRLKEPSADYQALQARVIQLEGQVKTLQLERDQSQLMLENMQQQHKHSMELMESTHRARVKLLEESAAQRETQMQRECEDLMERLSAASRTAEQERSELQAQYQRKLAQAQQDRDREVERLRDLQRKSILEMKKDHEDQIQRLKKLKEEEIDAVTSATSQTRSLTGVIEQMEQFSSQLGELSSRVESTHEHTAQGLEQGARHRDEQLRTMQERLMQQQKAMAEERAYLKEIISRMDTQLNEQQRQLEKERWKVTAEQAKAESTQRGLEEERRVLTMQISMEREELERAKSALLEEQKTVMQHCADERRKLAAEWAHFHLQEKQRRDRAEQEVSSLLERREGSIISLAQEQADMKLRTAELKRKETAVTQERETLDRLREDLDREKERISSTALRLKTRAQEVEAFSKLAADKYEEGERALQKARRVEGEHEARLRNIHTQTERLRQQEQRLLKEQLRRSDTHRLRPNTQIPPPLLSDPAVPNPELPPVLNVPPPSPPHPTSSQTMCLQASLALWKYTAQRDHEFLEEEQFFLENLKRKSFNTDQQQSTLQVLKVKKGHMEHEFETPYRNPVRCKWLNRTSPCS